MVVVIIRIIVVGRVNTRGDNWLLGKRLDVSSDVSPHHLSGSLFFLLCLFCFTNMEDPLVLLCVFATDHRVKLDPSLAIKDFRFF